MAYDRRETGAEETTLVVVVVVGPCTTLELTARALPTIPSTQASFFPAGVAVYVDELLGAVLGPAAPNGV
jgi:hypothetical protein